MGLHRINESLLKARVGVALVGAGGTGSQLLTGLARLNAAMIEMGHPGGLATVVFDPDAVTRANIGRQLFSPADLGQPKTNVLVHRLNAWYGLDWRAAPERFAAAGIYDHLSQQVHVVISCVDSAAARRDVYEQISGRHTGIVYWLDCGNRRSDGQMIFGEIHEPQGEPAAKGSLPRVPRERLPHVLDIYPELKDKHLKEDDAPSCSLAESLEKQDLFINDHISRWALHLLWTLFRTGSIEHHGYVINLADGVVLPIPVPD